MIDVLFLIVRQLFGLVLGLGFAAMIPGCAGLERLPAVPLADAPKSNVLNIPDARFYVAEKERILSLVAKTEQRRRKSKIASTHLHYLAISGGGDDGAFGAGLLVGWSDRGDRPRFDVVTGVSTGSMTAPFAFLGRDYDAQLKQVFTESAANSIYRSRSIVAAIDNDAMADDSPLRNMINRYVDGKMVQQIADEYSKGRLLLILTTNLDQGRPVIWNIGAIAESRHPSARKLIADVLLASASMPAIFPPVMIDVTLEGKRLQEMHVDGGVVAQAFIYPPSISLKTAAARLGTSAAKLRAARKRTAYVIRNGRFFRPEESTKRQTLDIAKQAISTMITSSGVNDTYRMYLITRRDGVDFNLASIGDDYHVPYTKPFDRAYMRSLFDYGYQKGRAGYQWQKTPPGYEE